MIRLADLAESFGAGLLQVELDPDTVLVDDITLAEPGSSAPPSRGDLLLGVGAGPSTAVDLLRRAADHGSVAVLLRRSLARRPEVLEAARTAPIAVVSLAEQASWAHVVWLLRGALDRTAAPVPGATWAGGGPPAGPRGPGVEPSVQEDLFVLADAAAALVGGAVTVEDARSRVLAYSARQDVTDPARVSTIIGRRVPEEVLAAYRAKGVFRRLAGSAEPFVVPPTADGRTRGRYVVPVRAGSEWLGSIWVMVDAEPPPEVRPELVRTASVVALHLLAMRSHSDLARRVARDRLRTALDGSATGARQWLPAGPWRVVALGAGVGADLWDSLLRRRSWPQPQLVDLDGREHALVAADGGPGSPGTWAWVQRVVTELAAEGEAVVAAAGGRVEQVSELPASRAQAREMLQVLEDRGTVRVGRRQEVAVAVDEAWAVLGVERAVRALAPGPLPGPVAVLAAHDARHGTDQLATLAAWLDHPGEPTRAAAGLHVHPNTVRYRMQRLHELVDLDLQDPEVRLALTLQLRALGVRGRAGAGV